MTATRILAFMLLLTTIGCDRVTKHIATATLAGNPARSYLSGTIQFEYAENTGAFLGLGAALPAWARSCFLMVGAALGLSVLAIAAFKRWTGLPFIGAILFVAGGASNLIDRITRGSVVDFMNVGVGPLRTGIFNVADVALIAGVAFMMFKSHQLRAWGDRPAVRRPRSGVPH